MPQGYNWDANESNDFYLKLLTSRNELNLRSDKWTDYLLNNKASINGGLAVQGAQFVANMGLGLATGGIGLAVAGSQAINFGASIANTMIQRQDIKQAPVRMHPADDVVWFLNLNFIIASTDCIEDCILPFFKGKVFYINFFHILNHSSLYRRSIFLGLLCKGRGLLCNHPA